MAAASFEAVFQVSPVPLLVVDAANLAFLASNAAATRRLGYADWELGRCTLMDLLDPEDRARVRTLAATATHRPSRYGLWGRSSWRLVPRSGPPQRMDVADAPFTFRGRPAVLLYQPAPTASSGVGSGVQAPGGPDGPGSGDAGFAFSAFHDLKEPILLVQGYLCLLGTHLAPGMDVATRDHLDVLTAATTQLQDLVLTLLEYYRLGAEPTALEPVDVEALLQDVLAALRFQVDAAGATVTHDPLPVVKVDRRHAQRLLQNLVSNAIKFRGQTAPRVHIDAVREGDRWHFTVADQGIGIEDAHLEAVFQPFHRLHSQDDYPGTGLGLSSCRRIVEAHGGRIWIESEVGRGTQVHFTLPADEEGA